jgi:5-formyltetrahydrofolate cyclo-ligase
MNKKQLRQQIRIKLDSITKPEYEDKSLRIAQTLFNEQSWINADTIGITISNHPEVDTYQIIRKAWELNKRVAVPKCIPRDKSMDFRVLEEFSQLESVFYGLFEPIVTKTIPITKDKIDLLIVPGVAFTKKGDRLGNGGGYFDRYLVNYSGQTLSLAFHEQVVTTLPIEANDIPVSKIITDQEVFETNG